MNAGTAAECRPTMLDLEESLEHALNEVFTTMLGHQPAIVAHEDGQGTCGLSAIVGFGGKISGLLALHLTPDNACKMAGGLLGMSFSTVDEIVCDAMGEMVNMLAGGLKKHASRQEELFKISIPSIIRGSEYSTHAPMNAERVALAVTAGPYSFIIQLAVELQLQR